MVRRRVLIAVAVVVIATTIVISMIAAQFLITLGTDAKGGSYDINEILFPKNLVLRGTKAATAKHPYVRHMLIDKDTIYPNPSQKDDYYADRHDYGSGSMALDSFPRTMYNKSFVYTKPPLKEYYILGMTSVSLTFNVSAYTTEGYSKKFDLWFMVSLWRISPDGTWDWVIDFGTDRWYVTMGAPRWEADYDESGLWFSHSVAHPIYIGPYEKIAVRIIVLGQSTSSGGCHVDLYHMYKMTKPNQFVVDLPIVEP